MVVVKHHFIKFDGAMKMITKGVRMDNELADRIEALGKRRGLDFSSMTRMMLIESVERMEEADQAKQAAPASA